MPGPFSHKCLVEMLQDENLDVRERTLETFTRRPTLPSVQALVALVQTECGASIRTKTFDALAALRIKMPPELGCQVDQHLLQVVSDLGDLRGMSRPPGAPTGSANDLLAELAMLARPPEKLPAVEYSPERLPPERPKADPVEQAEKVSAEQALKDKKKERDSELRKIMGRMKTALSALTPQDKKEAEKLIRAGRVVNEVQLKTAISRIRAKRKQK
jgi:hypothetical protein